MSWLGTSVQTSHDDHDDVVGRGEIDIVHDQELLITEARIGVDVGLPRGLGASLVLPVRMVSTSIRYLDDAGDEVELVEPGIHHRDETLTGLGNPMVLASYGRAFGDWHVSARAGATLPLGRTEEDPFALGAMDLAHEHIQMGTGTFAPVLAAEGGRTLGAWRVSGFVFTQQLLYANGRGYQAGDRYAGGLAVRRGVGARLDLRLGTELLAETAERWSGTVHTDDGNRGRLDWMLAAGVAWTVAPGWSLDLGVKVPIVTHVVGGQVDLPAIVELGASWAFGGRAPAQREHEEHEVVEATPGKLTIVDYWATWCEPCAILDPILADLARAHPEVELRKVDVSDWDDIPFVMPHVTIFDATGAQLLDASAGTNLDAFVASIRAVVEPTRIVVTEAGFEPGDVTVPAGEPVTLVFERRTEHTCATEVILVVGGERHEVALPLGEPVTLTVTFPSPGVVTYGCAMDMIHGTITVQ